MVILFIFYDEVVLLQCALIIPRSLFTQRTDITFYFSNIDFSL